VPVTAKTEPPASDTPPTASAPRWGSLASTTPVACVAGGEMTRHRGRVHHAVARPTPRLKPSGPRRRSTPMQFDPPGPRPPDSCPSRGVRGPKDPAPVDRRGAHDPANDRGGLPTPVERPPSTPGLERVAVERPVVCRTSDPLRRASGPPAAREQVWARRRSRSRAPLPALARPVPDGRPPVALGGARASRPRAGGRNAITEFRGVGPRAGGRRCPVPTKRRPAAGNRSPGCSTPSPPVVPQAGTVKVFHRIAPLAASIATTLAAPHARSDRFTSPNSAEVPMNTVSPLGAGPVAEGGAGASALCRPRVLVARRATRGGGAGDALAAATARRAGRRPPVRASATPPGLAEHVGVGLSVDGRLPQQRPRQTSRSAASFGLPGSASGNETRAPPEIAAEPLIGTFSARDHRCLPLCGVEREDRSRCLRRRRPSRPATTGVPVKSPSVDWKLHTGPRVSTSLYDGAPRFRRCASSRGSPAVGGPLARPERPKTGCVRQQGRQDLPAGGARRLPGAAAGGGPGVPPAVRPGRSVSSPCIHGWIEQWNALLAPARACRRPARGDDLPAGDQRRAELPRQHRWTTSCCAIEFEVVEAQRVALRRPQPRAWA